MWELSDEPPTQPGTGVLGALWKQVSPGAHSLSLSQSPWHLPRGSIEAGGELPKYTKAGNGTGCIIATGAAFVGVLPIGTGTCVMGERVGEAGKVPGTQ